MELFTTLSKPDVLSLIGLVLVIITAYLLIKQLHKSGFTYYKVTLYVEELNFGNALKFYQPSTTGNFLRKNLRNGQWEIRQLRNGWEPLDQSKVDMVEKMVSEGVPIEIDLD